MTYLFQTNLFWYLKIYYHKNPHSNSFPIRAILSRIFLISNPLPFVNAYHIWNFSLFFVQNGSLNHRSPIRLISFLENIRYNMQIRLQSDIHVRYSLEVTIVSLFQFFNSTVHLEILSVICPKWRCKSPISNQVDVISREKKPIRYNMQIRLQSDIHVRYSLEISIVSLFQFFNSTACF